MHKEKSRNFGPPDPFSSAKAFQESLYKIQYNLTTAHYNTHPDQIDQYNLTKMFVRILATSTLQLVCITLQKETHFTA